MIGSRTPDVTTNAAEAGRRSLAIAPRPVAALPADVLRRIDRLAAEIRASDPRIGDLSRFGPGVRRGIGAGPSVWFGDTAEIPLLAAHPGKRFDYRLGWLAQDRDVVVIGGPRSRAFEEYQRRHLGAPDIRYLNVDPDAGAPRRATGRSGPTGRSCCARATCRAAARRNPRPVVSRCCTRWPISN